MMVTVRNFFISIKASEVYIVPVPYILNWFMSPLMGLMSVFTGKWSGMEEWFAEVSRVSKYCTQLRLLKYWVLIHIRGFIYSFITLNKIFLALSLCLCLHVYSLNSSAMCRATSASPSWSEKNYILLLNSLHLSSTHTLHAYSIKPVNFGIKF